MHNSSIKHYGLAGETMVTNNASSSAIECAGYASVDLLVGVLVSHDLTKCKDGKRWSIRNGENTNNFFIPLTTQNHADNFVGIVTVGRSMNIGNDLPINDQGERFVPKYDTYKVMRKGILPPNVNLRVGIIKEIHVRTKLLQNVAIDANSDVFVDPANPGFVSNTGAIKIAGVKFAGTNASNGLVAINVLENNF